MSDHAGARRTRAIDGKLFFRSDLQQYAATGPLAILAARNSTLVPPVTVRAEVDAIPAIIEQDQWVVMCPDCTRNTQMVWLDEPFFMCAYCWNVKVGGKWRPIKLPSQQRRESIEEILGHRPFAYQRNWRGETLTALRRENIDEGDSVPDRGND